MILHAREAAIGFYERLGYRAESQIYFEVASNDGADAQNLLRSQLRLAAVGIVTYYGFATLGNGETGTREPRENHLLIARAG